MKLSDIRIDLTGHEPKEILDALFTIGHYLSNVGPDMDVSFNVTEGEEVITYELQVQEVNRYKWLIEEVNGGQS